MNGFLRYRSSRLLKNSCFISIYKQFLKAVITDSKVLPNIIVSFNVILSVFLVFRTNAASERFWEARKQWGTLVNTVRNLARGIWIVVEEREPKDREEKEAALRLVVAFAVANEIAPAK